MVGTTLSGRYTLTERIASGGMGEVWQARDGVLGRIVAVKVLRPNAEDEPRFAQRFHDEARHSASLSHANIATVYDYGEDAGTAYLVMELVRGTPLSRLIATRGALGPALTRSIIGQAALALAAAHEKGVIHRDVKPANIIVTPEGIAKLTDFGIARALDSSSHTRTGEVVGTPHYLSPEQALGRPATGASDLYALGVVAHEMLTGRRPFDAGSAVATALAQVHDAPPPLPADTPNDLRAVIDQCLDKDPSRRPRSAAAMAAALGHTVPGLSSAVEALDLTDPGFAVPGSSGPGSGRPGSAAPGSVAPGVGAPTMAVPAPQPTSPPTALLPGAGVGAAAGSALGAGAAGTGPGPASTPEGTRGARHTAGAHDDEERDPDRISPWWFVVSAIALGLIAFFLWQIIGPGSKTPQPRKTTYVTVYPTTTTSSTTSIPTTSTTTTTTTTSEATVVVDLGAYLHRPATEVVPELKALPVRVRTQEFITTEYPAGTVLNIEPSGPLVRGSTVLVSIAAAPPSLSTGPTG